MPTAAKFVAAIVFGLVTWFATRLVIPYLPDGMRLAWFTEIATFFGIAMGWTVMGSRAGRGVVSGLGIGLTTVVAIVFWCLLTFAGEEMLDRSMNLRYDGPMKALAEGVKLMIEYGQYLLQPDILIWLVVGGLFGGWVTELTARKWS